MKKIYCPICGREANKIQTIYGIRNYCQEHNVWSWGDAPLVDKRTHKARQKAHECFDIIWKSGILTRSRAYTWLSKTLKISKRKCHIKQFDYNQCKEVIRICKHFKKFIEIR